jgi:Fe-S cluster assembly protein SufD
MTEAIVRPGSKGHSHGGGDIPLQTRSERIRSANKADHSAIDARDEQWRYLDSSRLAGLDVNELRDASSDITVKAPSEFEISFAKASDPVFGTAGLPEDVTSANAWAAASNAVKVVLGSDASEPAVISAKDLGADRASHIIIQSKTHAHGTVILDHTGDAKLAEVVEILVGDESSMTVVSIQDWNQDAVHTSAQFARLGRNSKLKHIVVTLGGKTVRVTPSAEFSAPGGEVELLGLYFADSGQHLEHRSYVDHAVANCKSRVTYKGALQGKDAHTVWVGDVLIRKAAEGTDTYELNRNLLLTDGARADSVPNLEIETGEIEGAGHASASGRFDDEQLFYLQARGITELEARRLVVRGFLNEIIQQIKIESVEDRLNQAIEHELSRSNN